MEDSTLISMLFDRDEAVLAALQAQYAPSAAAVCRRGGAAVKFQ